MSQIYSKALSRSVRARIKPVAKKGKMSSQHVKVVTETVKRAMPSTFKMAARTFQGLCPNPAILPPQAPHDAGKLTVVLDIDETLIHTDMQEAMAQGIRNNAEQEQEKATDREKRQFERFNIDLDGHKVNVYRRPHLDWFLKEASTKFELVTFTAGVQYYGKSVLEHIDPNQERIRHRFYRHHCTHLDTQVYTKDLSALGRPLSRVVLVDNNPICFLPNPDNGIPVNSFLAKEHDNTLQTLMTLLDYLNAQSDVRPVLQRFFKLSSRLQTTVDAHL